MMVGFIFSFKFLRSVVKFLLSYQNFISTFSCSGNCFTIIILDVCCFEENQFNNCWEGGRVGSILHRMGLSGNFADFVTKCNTK